jgi:hypothetical protein
MMLIRWEWQAQMAQAQSMMSHLSPEQIQAQLEQVLSLSETGMFAAYLHGFIAPNHTVAMSACPSALSRDAAAHVATWPFTKRRPSFSRSTRRVSDVFHASIPQKKTRKK